MLEVKDDEFGLYVDMPDYDSFDEIEYLFIERHGIEPIGAKVHSDLGENLFRLWFDHGVGGRVVQDVVDKYFQENS